ncbi:MAG: hypothetical protein ABJO06_14200, partial [Roseibium sp.]
MSKKTASPTDKAPETPEKEGFGEAPQAALEGAPLSGSISDWAKEIEEEAAKPVPKAKSSGAHEDTEDQAERPQGRTAAARSGRARAADAQGASGVSARKNKSAKSTTARSARGTSMGKADSARERAS